MEIRKEWKKGKEERNIECVDYFFNDVAEREKSGWQ